MQKDVIVLEAGRSNERYWRELWAARELIWILARRDISVRYKQSALGVSWVLLKPLMTMLIFTFVFEKIARLPSDGGLPYSIMVLSGMIPWILFSTSLPDLTNSLVSNANMIGKVFFPRLAIPIASLSNAILEFTICTILMLVFMLLYGLTFSWTLLFLPLFAVFALFASIGLGLWWATLNVRYRDFRFVIPFVVQAGLYLTPIGYSSQLVPEKWQPFFYLNPMVVVVDGFRWAISGGESVMSWASLAGSATTSGVFLCIGLYYFRKYERTFADVI
jgi:lipopolysaccharide transport system permease protein